jgi:hypothetical protein
VAFSMMYEAGTDRTGTGGHGGCAGAGRGTLRSRRFTELVRGRREELGLSMSDVAARLRVSTGVYGNWENCPSGEWTVERIGTLAEVLELTEQQGTRLIRLAVDRETGWEPQQTRPHSALGPARPSGPAFPVGPPRGGPPRRPAPPAARTARPAATAPERDPGTRAYLLDHAALMDAVPLPSVLFDRRWEVAHANPAFRALFRGIGPHPTAMPDRNFLRFALFHPDAGTVLADRETSWCLPLLAQLESALEDHGDDEVLNAVRDDIARDPIMDAAYRHGLRHWVRATGAAAFHHDGAVRPLHHPDPGWGRAECRIIDETPATLQDRGYTRITLVPRNGREPAAPPAPRGRARLRAVSGG